LFFCNLSDNLYIKLFGATNMYNELIEGKVYYKIFDKSFKESSHIYAKYKLNNELSTEEIDNNKKAILSYLEADDIFVLKQVHGNKIINADIIDNFNIEPEADGAVTTRKNLVLTIQTADCVPILLTSEDGNVIGAAHCGWKSAKANIISNLVDMMQARGASQIKAFIGPAIQQYSYEVDSEYYNNFIMENSKYAKFFIPSVNDNHYMFDLPSFVEMKLIESNVNEINKSLEDTYSQKEKYPSYRRSCHLGIKYNKNILSAIMIKH